MITVKTFINNPLDENTYVVSDASRQAVIIDCGALSATEREAIRQMCCRNPYSLCFSSSPTAISTTSSVRSGYPTLTPSPLPCWNPNFRSTKRAAGNCTKCSGRISSSRFLLPAKCSTMATRSSSGTVPLSMSSPHRDTHRADVATI